MNSRRISRANCIRCPKAWRDKDSGLASTKSGLAALRDFDAAFVRLGSPPEVALFGLMSAFATCGHSAANA